MKFREPYQQIKTKSESINEEKSNRKIMTDFVGPRPSNSSSQIQSVTSKSKVHQPHFLDVSSSNSKSDIKDADRVLPEASINLKNEELLTSNVASNKISFTSFVKVNSDVPTPETKEHTYKYDTANFRFRGSHLSDIQRKQIIQNVFVPHSSSHFPKVDGRQFKRNWLKQFP